MGPKQHAAESSLCCQERELSLNGDDREDGRAGGCSWAASTGGECRSSELAVVAGASSQVGYHINLT